MKKGRAKGKAAIITDDEYRDNLVSETIKNIKKERQDKASKSVIVPDNPESTPSKVPVERVPKPRKRKQPSTDAGTLKRKPLTDLNNQINVNNVNNVLPISQMPVQIINTDSVSLQEGQYLLQEDGSLFQVNIPPTLPIANVPINEYVYYTNNQNLDL